MRVSPSELYDVPTDVDDDGVWDIGFAECVKNIEPLAIDIAAGAHGLRREARIGQAKLDFPAGIAFASGWNPMTSSNTARTGVVLLLVHLTARGGGGGEAPSS